MKKLLLTGATGFIGRAVAHYFDNSGYSVVGIGTRPPENAPIHYLTHYHQIMLPSSELGDIIKYTAPDLCIHCAGRASIDLSIVHPNEDFTASVEVTFNLLDNLRLYAPHCQVIYLSSAAVYGNPMTLPVTETHLLSPISPYGFHKLICEQICKEFTTTYGIPTAIVRIFSAYGPGLRRQVLWDMCVKALTQPALQLRGTGNESRDFICSRDLVKALFLIAKHGGYEAEAYNIASGVEVTIKDLANLVIGQLEKPISVEFDGKNPPGTPLNWRADITRLHKLGFSPEIPIEAGVEVYLKWCHAEIQG